MYKVKPQEYHNLRKAFYTIRQGKVSDTLSYVTNTNDILTMTKADDVKMELDDTLVQYKDYAQNKIFTDYVKPVQESYKKTEAALDNILKTKKLKIDDPDLKRTISQLDKNKLEVSQGLLFAAVSERNGNKDQLLNSIQRDVLKKIK